MGWQEQQQQLYKQQKAAKELARQQETAERNRKLQARFAEQARLQEVQAIERERKAEARRIEEQQQQAEAAQRLADGLKLLDEQRQVRQIEAARMLRLEAIAKKQGSPIEASFYEEWCKQFPGIELKRQYPIGKYRVDFAHVETKTIIELDGYTYHSSKRDRNKDYSRQHEIEDQGWLFVRFTGSQIFSDVSGCVQIAGKRILQRGQ